MTDRDAVTVPLFAGSDIPIAISIPVLKLLARFLPESNWPRFSYIAAHAGRQSMVPGGAGLEARMRTMLSGSANAPEPRALLLAMRALEIEAALQIWRIGQRPDWRPPLRLIGIEHLERALAGGSGAILWVGHFVFASLFAKTALYDVGYGAFHLSHPRHGFSPTRFGIRFLNRSKQRIETRYLAERVELSPANPGIALRHLRTKLKDNALVSITAGVDAAWPAVLPFLGDRIALATGAADLAHTSGAPLLPVFVWRDESGVIVVEIEPPVPVDRESPRPESSATAVQRYADRQAIHVRAWPEQWLGWTTLRPLKSA